VFPKVFLILAAFSPAAVAQVQLQFALPEFGPFNATYTYGRVLPLSNNDTLVIGSSRLSSAIGLYNPPVQHAQIALAAFGSVPFQNGEPPDLLPVLGGSGNDVPQAAAVDPSGNIWIVGNTDSDDFHLVNPIVPQKVPYRTAGFVIELDPTGTKLLFATYLAGQQHSSFVCSICFYASNATTIAVDKSGNIYVGGSTNETDFPTTPGAFMTKGGAVGASSFGDTFFYSFVLKISPTGKLVYSTLLGTGNSSCVGGSSCIGHESTSATVNSMAVDGAGAVTVSGIKGGSYNLGSGYVLRLAVDGSKLLWATSVGSSYGGVTTLLMAQDSNTSVDLFGRYVIPIVNPGLPPQAGTPGLFAAQLSTDGSTMIYSTDLGQSPDANATGIALDASGNPYLAGSNSSAQFLALPGVPNLGADFVLRLDASGAKLQALFRFPLGAIGAPPAFDSSGRILLLGSTGALVTLPANYAFDTPAIVGYANAASFALNTGLAPGELVSLFGFDLDGSPQNVQVSFDGVPAAVLYAGPNQINVQVPFEFSQYLSPGPQIQVVLPSGSITLKPVASAESPGIFTTDGVHAVALNQDGSVNSTSNPAARGSIVTLFGTGAVWPSGIQDGAVAASAVPLDQEQNRLEVVDSLGTPASILYFGTAPALIYGVFQVNVRLPPDAVPPLTLQAPDSARSSNAVQIYLK
jgi:uncharacterized protein (TIGR03437 family)